MAQDFRILIPTYNRPELIQEATLAYLERCNVPPEQVDIWVSGVSQVSLYDSLPDHWKSRLIIGEKGLMANRRAAELGGRYKEGERLLWVNDDIYAIREAGTDGKFHEANIFSVAYKGFGLCQEYSANLWGIYAVANTFFMSDKIHTDLRYVVGCFYGVILRKLKCLQPVFGDAKEDYERALRFYQQDDRIIRMDQYSPRTVYYNSPEIFPNLETIEANIQMLERMWPTWVKRNTRRKGKWPEILIRDPLRRTRPDPSDSKPTGEEHATA